MLMLVVRQLVKNVETLNLDEVAALEKKLERCRSQENNPLSELCVFAFRTEGFAFFGMAAHART